MDTPDRLTARSRPERCLLERLVVVAMAQLKRDHPELALTATDEAVFGVGKWIEDVPVYVFKLEFNSCLARVLLHKNDQGSLDE